jgi:hypothetical protein
VQTIVGPPVNICAFGSTTCALVTATATCPAGTVVTGGGFSIGLVNAFPTISAPQGNGWRVDVVNLGTFTGVVNAVAMCASAT